MRTNKIRIWLVSLWTLLLELRVRHMDDWSRPHLEFQCEESSSSVNFKSGEAGTIYLLDKFSHF